MTRLLILLEGVDGGGKSTLADALTKAYRKRQPDGSVTLLKKGQPELGVSGIDEYELPLEDLDLRAKILTTDHLVIMDRWHVGERIYGPLYRGVSRLTDGEILHVELLLTSLNTVKVLVQPQDWSEVARRLRRRGEDFLKPEHVHSVHRCYESHASKYGYRRADSSQVDNLLQSAEMYADDQAAPSLTQLPGFLGNPWATRLLVGDRRNSSLSYVEATHKRAFTPTNRAGSSSYLLDSMIRAGLSQNIGLVNAYEDGIDVNLVKTLSEVHVSKVVALGAMASTKLTDLGIEHATVPHPQWWRRFRHKDMQGYVDLLRGELEVRLSWN